MFLFLPALGSSGREEDQVSGGAAGGDADEEVGDKTASLRGAGDYHGPRERGGEAPAASPLTVSAQ